MKGCLIDLKHPRDENFFNQRDHMAFIQSIPLVDGARVMHQNYVRLSASRAGPEVTYIRPETLLANKIKHITPLQTPQSRAGYFLNLT